MCVYARVVSCVKGSRREIRNARVAPAPGAGPTRDPLRARDDVFLVYVCEGYIIWDADEGGVLEYYWRPRRMCGRARV